MKDFKELGITASAQNFVGEKIHIDRVVNKQINVLDFKIEESQFKEKGNGKYMRLQIEFNGEKRVVHTGSIYLMEMIQRVDKSVDIPFRTTIIKDEQRYEFT